MGWFFNTNPYSKRKDEHYIPAEDIKRIASHYRIVSLTDAEAKTVDEFIITKQHYHNGKISLYLIYEVLQKLFMARQISKIDRDALMKGFVEFFDHHYSHTA